MGLMRWAVLFIRITAGSRPEYSGRPTSSIIVSQRHQPVALNGRHEDVQPPVGTLESSTRLVRPLDVSPPLWSIEIQEPLFDLLVEEVSGSFWGFCESGDVRMSSVGGVRLISPSAAGILWWWDRCNLRPITVFSSARLSRCP